MLLVRERESVRFDGAVGVAVQHAGQYYCIVPVWIGM